MAEHDINNDKLAPTSHRERERRILAYWKEKGIFEKSLAKESPKGDYTFYDGPPFATGTPHYGHIVPNTVKDVIPRWKTMQGYHVRRRWGWDCHGLPVENLIEKELGLNSKKDILDYGVDKFNEEARKSVMRYADEWRDIVPRLGRFVDMDDDYRTMDTNYTETVWWIFKELHNKGLVYEGFKSMNLCPHCETTLSNFEVAQGYKDITDISVYVKFRLSGCVSGTTGRDTSVIGDTHLLAWTTTPWTLPGNVALAVNPKIDYVKISIGEGDEQKRGQYILAKERLSVLKDLKYEVLETIHGSKLVGLSYQPLFDYYSKDLSLRNRENGWKIYGADFVTTEDGTGIVHIAPAFGADDYDLLLGHNLPFVQHVSTDGRFKKEATDFAGQNVKPRDTDRDKNLHQTADIEIIKWLARNNVLFEKEKLVHSYPHCWRCQTPLLNYATSSWFVEVTAIKDKLVAENKKITWVPPEVGSARFGNWLEGARDWAVSRSRFWGAPIPVWRESLRNGHEDGDDKKGQKESGKCHFIGSIEELKKCSKAKNTYYIMRHGEAENNTQGILNADPKTPFRLTEHGKKQVAESAKALAKIDFDIIYVSPFARTLETLSIVKEKLGKKDIQVITDDRIGELNTGSWNGRKVDEFFREFPFANRFEKMPEGGETYADIKKRMGNFLTELEKKHKNKTILIISHETPLFLLVSGALGLDRPQSLAMRGEKEYIANAEVRKLEFVPLPHNAEYELDLHKPYIDEIELTTENGNILNRVTDVFDCWFESGSMPYGEAHYPFEKEDFEPKSSLLHKSRGYPADFIAEGLDQTRGWFYTMLILGVALFDKAPYKKVIVNGLVLAEDGEKMSKSKKNYPDPMLIVDKYGADSLRYYLLSSPVVRGQDLCFSEKGVDEVVKKIVNRLLNVVTFYKTYANQDGSDKLEYRENVLDQWITARLNELVSEVSLGLEKGEIDRATRPFLDFVDDLSTWYLRRSRERFKTEDEDKEAALETTRFILETTAKLLAPFMPFLAEDIYLGIGGPLESVHLESWPEADSADTKSLEMMKVVRSIASQGLEARMTAKLNVRQPLSKLKIQSSKYEEINPQYIELIKDEVNVKEVVFGADTEYEVELDTFVTPELKEEGDIRELTRKIQDLRKEKGLKIGELAVLIATNDLKERISKNIEFIKKSTSISDIEYGGELKLKS